MGAMDDLLEHVFATEGGIIEKRQRKDKKITFRLTPEIYEKLEKLADLNKVSLSEITEQVVRNWLEDFIQLPFERSRYLNTCHESRQTEITTFELAYPPAYRQFTNARKKYPDAPRLDGLELEALTRVLEKDKPSRQKQINELEDMLVSMKKVEKPTETQKIYLDMTEKRLQYLKNIDLDLEEFGVSE